VGGGQLHAGIGLLIVLGGAGVLMAHQQLSNRASMLEGLVAAADVMPGPVAHASHTEVGRAS